MNRTGRSSAPAAANCALRPDQYFRFTWTDAQGQTHHEDYPGLIGLAPQWAAGPLDELGKRMVSACLAARVNYYEVPVMISLRSERPPLKPAPKSTEIRDFPHVEGAFWGNLFTDQPYLNACYNDATVENSREWQRDCAAGHVGENGQIEECGVINIVGPCKYVCQPLKKDSDYYPQCFQRPGQSLDTTKDVITTALP